MISNKVYWSTNKQYKCVHFVFINVLEFAVLFIDSHFLNVYKKKMNYLGYYLFII